METEGGVGGTLVSVTVVVSGVHGVSGESQVVYVADLTALLDNGTIASPVTLYGGTAVHNIGGSPAANFALSMIQPFVCEKSSDTTEDSQIKTFESFFVQ